MNYLLQVQIEDGTEFTYPIPQYGYTVDEKDLNPNGLGVQCKSVKITKDGKLFIDYTGQLVSVYIQRTQNQ